MASWGLRKGKSIGVHDDLKARALVLDDGKSRVAIVAIDVAYVYESITQDIRKRVRQLTGIKEQDVMVCASHTHTGPMMGNNNFWPARGESQYLKTFPEYVAGTVAAARALLEPALVSSSTSEVKGVTVNRRHPEQPVDATLSVLKVVGTSGNAIAEVINFGCHPVAVGGQYLVWSADFPGLMCSFVERAVPGSTCLFINGAAGDVQPWDMYFGNEHPKHAQTHEEAEKFGRVLGSEAIRSMETMPKPKAVALRSKTTTLRLKLREMPSENEARKLLDSILSRYKPWTKDTWDPGDHVSTIFNKHPGQYMIANAQSLLDFAKNNKGEMSMEMQVFGLDDLALVAIPGEVFSNLGLQIRRESSAKQTFIMGYANEMPWYIPTVEAITECENLPLEEGFGLRYTYGATLPVTQVSKQAVKKLSSTASQMASQITSR